MQLLGRGTLAEKFPNAIGSRHLSRGLGLFLTGAPLMGSLIDCDGEGPQLSASLTLPQHMGF